MRTSQHYLNNKEIDGNKMGRRLTLPQLKKYDITQRVIEELADAESKIGRASCRERV